MVKVRVSTRADLSLIEDDLAESIEQYLGEAAEALTDRQRAAVCSRLAEMAASLMQKIQRNVTLDDGELPDSDDEDQGEDDDDDDNGDDGDESEHSIKARRKKHRQVELADVLQGDDESRALEAEVGRERGKQK